MQNKKKSEIRKKKKKKQSWEIQYEIFLQVSMTHSLID